MVPSEGYIYSTVVASRQVALKQSIVVRGRSYDVQILLPGALGMPLGVATAAVARLTLRSSTAPGFAPVPLASRVVRAVGSAPAPFASGDRILAALVPGPGPTGSGDLSRCPNLASSLASPVDERRCMLAKVGAVRRPPTGVVGAMRDARPLAPPRRWARGTGRSWSEAPNANDMRLYESDSSESVPVSSVGLLGDGWWTESSLRRRLILRAAGRWGQAGTL